MQTPSSRHLSHDFIAYKGLSLHELFITAAVTTLCVTVFFILMGIAVGWMVAMGAIGFLLGFIIGMCFVPKYVARMKAGKPYGYLMKKLTFVLARLGLKKSHYLNYTGAWQTSKTIRRSRV